MKTPVMRIKPMKILSLILSTTMLANSLAPLTVCAGGENDLSFNESSIAHSKPSSLPLKELPKFSSKEGIELKAHLNNFSYELDITPFRDKASLKEALGTYLWVYYVKGDRVGDFRQVIKNDLHINEIKDRYIEKTSGLLSTRGEVEEFWKECLTLTEDEIELLGFLNQLAPLTEHVKKKKSQESEESNDFSTALSRGSSFQSSLDEIPVTQAMQTGGNQGPSGQQNAGQSSQKESKNQGTQQSSQSQLPSQSKSHLNSGNPDDSKDALKQLSGFSPYDKRLPNNIYDVLFLEGEAFLRGLATHYGLEALPPESHIDLIQVVLELIKNNQKSIYRGLQSIQALEDDVQSLEEKIKSLQREYERGEAELRKEQEENQNLAKDISALEKEIVNLQGAILGLEKALKPTESSVAATQMNQKKNVGQNQKKTPEQRLDEAKLELQQSEEVLKYKKEKEAALARGETKEQALRQRLKESEDSLRSSQRELQAKQLERENLIFDERKDFGNLIQGLKNSLSQFLRGASSAFVKALENVIGQKLEKRGDLQRKLDISNKYLNFIEDYLRDGLWSSQRLEADLREGAVFKQKASLTTRSAKPLIDFAQSLNLVISDINFSITINDKEHKISFPVYLGKDFKIFTQADQQSQDKVRDNSERSYGKLKEAADSQKSSSKLPPDTSSEIEAERKKSLEQTHHSEKAFLAHLQQDLAKGPKSQVIQDLRRWISYYNKSPHSVTINDISLDLFSTRNLCGGCGMLFAERNSDIVDGIIAGLKASGIDTLNLATGIDKNIVFTQEYKGSTTIGSVLSQCSIDQKNPRTWGSPQFLLNRYKLKKTEILPSAQKKLEEGAQDMRQERVYRQHYISDQRTFFVSEEKKFREGEEFAFELNKLASKLKKMAQDIRIILEKDPDDLAKNINKVRGDFVEKEKNSILNNNKILVENFPNVGQLGISGRKGLQELEKLLQQTLSKAEDGLSTRPEFKTDYKIYKESLSAQHHTASLLNLNNLRKREQAALTIQRLYRYSNQLEELSGLDTKLQKPLGGLRAYKAILNRKIQDYKQHLSLENSVVKQQMSILTATLEKINNKEGVHNQVNLHGASPVVSHRPKGRVQAALAPCLLAPDALCTV